MIPGSSAVLGAQRILSLGAAGLAMVGAARVLGADSSEFAVVAVLMNSFQLLSLANLGVPSAIVTPLSRYLALGELGEAQAVFRWAQRRLTILGVGVALGIAALTLAPGLRTVFGVKTSPATISGAVLLVGVSVGIGIALGHFGAVAQAVGQHKKLAWCNTAGTAVQYLVVGLLWACKAQSPALWIGAGSAGGVAGVLVTSVIFQRVARSAGLVHGHGGFQHSPGRPRFAGLGRAGGLYLLIVVGNAIAVQTDTIVIAHLVSDAAVGGYAVSYRVATIVPVVGYSAMLPLWSQIATLDAMGGGPEIRALVLRWLIASAALGAVAAGLIVAIGDEIFRFLAGEGVIISPSLRWSMAAIVLVMSLMGPLSMFLNGRHLVAEQATMVAMMVSLNLALSLYLANRIGQSGPAWATAIAQVLCVVVPTLWYLLRPAALPIVLAERRDAK